MDFEIIVIISWRRNQMTKKRDVMLEPFPFGRNKNRAPDLRSDAFPNASPLHLALRRSGAAGAAPVPLSGRAAQG